MSQALEFINQGVLKRLEEGSFVPARKSTASSNTPERRKQWSPLAVTKRCIRYEPWVFSHRRALILQMAKALNQPETKIFLVGGPQGIGKTSLVRGLIELMGGRADETRPDPQVLWFDANRHTDFEEIIQFLIQGILELYGTATDFDRRADRSRAGGSVSSSEDPLTRLEKSLDQAEHMPLLLVLDNVEFIVDMGLRLHSLPFKELLNFLLARPNIKIALLGERLPYADMSPNQEGVLDIRLDGIGETDALAYWRRKNKKTETDPGILEENLDETDTLTHLYRKTQGNPWLIKAIDSIQQQSGLSYPTLNRLLNGSGELIASLIQLAYERLPDQHRRLFFTLAFLRHPVSAQGLQALSQVCFPVLETGREANTTDLLEHSLIRPFLKICFPPQQVLNHIRHRTKSGEKYPPWFELYLSARQALYQTVSSTEQARIHDALQGFYLKDKASEAEQRILRIKNRAMLAEAKYHGSLARSRPEAKTGAGVSISSKAYVYQQGGLAGGIRKTLDDYRKIRLPDLPENPVTPEDEESLESPVSLPPASFTDILATLDSEAALEQELTFSDSSPPPPPRQDLSLPKPSQAHSPEPVSEEPPPVEPDFRQLTQPLLSEVHTTSEEQRIQQRLAAAVSSHDVARMAKELLALAQYRTNHGRGEEALQCLEKAIQLKPGHALLGEIYLLSGSIHKARYQHNAAVSAFSKAIAYLEPLMLLDVTDPSQGLNLAKAYQDLGDIQAYRKQYREASESLQKAIHWNRQAGEEQGLGELYFQLAGVFESLNQPEEAIAQYQNALEIDTKQNNLTALAATWANLGNLHLELGKQEQALQAFERSLECDRKLNEVEGQLSTLETLAKIYREQGNERLAEQNAQQGLSLAIQQRTRLWQCRFYTLLGQWAEARADWPKALLYYERAYSCGEQELSTESLAWLGGVIQALKEKGS